MGKILLLASYKGSKYELEIKSKITRIVGKSATGKTSLSVAFSRKERSLTGYTLLGLKGYNITSAITGNEGTFAEAIRKYKNHILIIDEEYMDEMRSYEVALAIQQNTSCYFIIMGRGDYPGLNIDIDSVCQFKLINGVNVLQRGIECQTDVRHAINFTHCVMEDTGKAFAWCSTLMRNSIEVIPAKSGKETFCDTVRDVLENNPDAIILMLFDRVSFGNCYTEYKKLINMYGSRLFVLNDYKSWEYLMLRTNMFKNRFVEYSIATGLFEERYYEELLRKVSLSRFGTIKHAGGSLSKCYTEPCCAFISGSNRDCSFGLATGPEKDKFIDLLKGTEFKSLLKISGRI